jgi:hypothetical protein
MTLETSEVERRLRQKLDPEVLRWHLGVVGLVTTLHEAIKSLVIGSVHDFVTFLGREERYRREVLALGNGRFDASCRWLENAGALKAGDRDVLDRFKRLRDSLTHEFVTIAFSPDHDVDVSTIVEVGDVVRRLDVFWVRLDVDANPAFDGQDIADEEMCSGLALFLDALLSALVEPYLDADHPRYGRSQG